MQNFVRTCREAHCLISERNLNLLTKILYYYLKNGYKRMFYFFKKILVI